MVPALTLMIVSFLPAIPYGVAGNFQVPASSTTNADSLTSQARTLVAEGNRTEARRLLQTALEVSPNSPPANLLLGTILLDEHKLPESMDRFETVLNIEPHNTEARAKELQAAIALALQARRDGNQQAALTCLEHARTYLPDDPVLLTDLGIQAQLLHQLPDAQTAFEAALRLQPNDPTATYGLARVEIDQQKLPAAVAHLRTYLAARPADASAHFGLGHVLYMQQNLEEARAEFERSISLQPAQTESFYQLGQMDLDAHHDAEAAVNFQRALTRDPRHGGALTGMGILAYRAKNFPIAREHLEAAVRSSPDYQPAHYYLGLTLAKLGDQQAAAKELVTATELAHTQQAPPPLQTAPSK